MPYSEGRAAALSDLEEVRKAVFGDVGDEPDVYADYDLSCELAGKMRRAIEVLGGACPKCGAMESALDCPQQPCPRPATEIPGADYDTFHTMDEPMPNGIVRLSADGVPECRAEWSGLLGWVNCDTGRVLEFQPTRWRSRCRPRPCVGRKSGSVLKRNPHGRHTCKV